MTSSALLAHGPAELIDAVPYLLGFHPRDSLVVVGLDEGFVVVTIRVDLEDVISGYSLIDAVAAMARGGASEFVGIVFAEDAAPDPEDAAVLSWWGLALDLAEAVEAASGELGDVLLVADSRFWSYLCDEPGCCPPEGSPLLGEDSEIAARATFAGLVALPDRAAVQRLLDPATGRDRPELRMAIDEELESVVARLAEGTHAQAERRDVRALFKLCRAVHEDPTLLPLSDAELARWAVALRRIPVRDSVWTALDDGRLAGDELWRYLAQELPRPFDAAALFLTGWVNWRTGNGALARIAADRALVSDPGYSAADLLGAAVGSGLDPRGVPRLRQRGSQAARTKM